MRLEWTFLPGPALAVAAACVAAALCGGLALSARILAARPAKRLRHL
jgi:hypothetical protein